MEPGDGNQRLELVIRDYLEVFREIMRDPRWREQFDLAFRPSFDAGGRRLIGPPCSALSWEHIQTKLGNDIAVSVSQLHFDGTLMGPSTGIESGYLASMNLRLLSSAKFQLESVKMFALIPTYDKDAAAQTLSKEDTKKREMELHQAFIGVIVRMLNMYSLREGRWMFSVQMEMFTPCLSSCFV